jgi:hypothetical protein
MTIPKDKSEGVITFPGNVERGLSRGVVVFDAITIVGGREVRVTLPPITVEVVRPFAMEVIEQHVSIHPTGGHALTVIVRREETFKDEVRVRVDDLPKGIVAEPLTIVEGGVSGNIQINAAEAVPGEYTIKLVAATDASGRKQTKDYELPPQPIRLTVTSPPKEEKK